MHNLQERPRHSNPVRRRNRRTYLPRLRWASADHLGVDTLDSTGQLARVDW